MKIPGKIKIGGLTYAVEETEHITLGTGCCGETLFLDLKINIRPSAREHMERTFWHEVFHAIYDNLGYTQHDEKQIDELAGALYGIIKDNPGIFENIGGESGNV
jgi:hypothetical protein